MIWFWKCCQTKTQSANAALNIINDLLSFIPSVNSASVIWLWWVGMCRARDENAGGSMSIAGAGCFLANGVLAGWMGAEVGWQRAVLSARGQSDSLPLSSLTSTYSLILMILASGHFRLDGPAHWTSDALPSVWTPSCFIWPGRHLFFGAACPTLWPPFALPQLLSHFAFWV